MAFGEYQVQQVVHSIEQGHLAGLIRISLTIGLGGAHARRAAGSSGLPLKVPLMLAGNQCVYFSDRVRWNQAAGKPPDEQTAK